MVPRYLVVANQTLASQELWKEIDKRLEAAPDASFYVVVPNTAAVHYHVVPAAGGFVPMPSLITGTVPETDEEATSRAQQALDEILARLRQRTTADGELGCPDPYEAVQEALTNRQCDEILLSTLPERHSRWRRMDTAGRISRHFKVPVTTITAKGA